MDIELKIYENVPGKRTLLSEFVIPEGEVIQFDTWISSNIKLEPEINEFAVIDCEIIKKDGCKVLLSRIKTRFVELEGGDKIKFFINTEAKLKEKSILKVDAIY